MKLFINATAKTTRRETFTYAWMILLLLSISCSDSEKPAAACISNTETEIFAGEVLSLSSCTTNALEYVWTIRYGQIMDTKKGQSVDVTFPGEAAGAVTISLTTKDANGTSQAEMKITVKSATSVGVTESGVYGLANLAVVQLTNKNFYVFSTASKNNEATYYQLVVDNKFSKVKSSFGDPWVYYPYLSVIPTSEGMLWSGAGANGGQLITRSLDVDGNILWSKNSFPGTSFPNTGSRGEVKLIEAFELGTVLGESMTVANEDNVSDIFVYKFFGQGVSWSTRFSHSEKSAFCDIIKNTNQYVVLSVDFTNQKTFIDVLDKEGKIVLQKELAIKSDDIYYKKAKILFVDGKYILSVYNSNVTKFYILDSNFTIQSETSITGVPATLKLDKVSDGYLLFGQNCTMIKIDLQGKLIFSSTYAESGVRAHEVIKDADSNYVFVFITADSKTIGFIKVSPQGKIIK